MLIRSRDIDQLSKEVRQIIHGKDLDLRDHKEGPLSVLRDDIHALARMKADQVDVLQHDYSNLKDVLADISHQLKTPLTAAILRADLLESSPPEKQAEFVHEIIVSLERTKWLTTALLNMAKVEVGAVEFSPALVGADELVSEALIPLRALADLKSISIETSGMATLNCDMHWTREALMNLVNNAMEHSPEGSTISIEAGENPLSSWVSVSDQGRGFSRTQIQEAFQRFEGSGTSTGHGIGLPLALKIMRAQNGEIEIANRPLGKGAIVTLKFYKQTSE